MTTISTATTPSFPSAIHNELLTSVARKDLNTLENAVTSAITATRDSRSSASLYLTGGLDKLAIDNQYASLEEYRTQAQNLKERVSSLPASTATTELLDKIGHISHAILFIHNFLQEAKKSFSLPVTGLENIKPHPLLGKIALKLLNGKKIEMDTARGKNHDGFIAQGTYGAVFYAKIDDIRFVMKRALATYTTAEAEKTKTEGRYAIRLSGQNENLLNIISQAENSSGEIISYYEECYCDLLTILNQGISYDEEEMHQMYLSLFQAVSFLNTHNLAHRDIKFLNVLHKESNALDELGTLKIGDFGEVAPADTATTYAGSPGFCAPEVLLATGTTSALKTDAWSLGVMMFIQLTDQISFHKANFETPVPIIENFKKLRNQPGAMYQKIMSAKLAEPGDDADYKLRHLLTKLIVMDPAKRITATEALAHPYFTGEATTRDFKQEIKDAFLAIEGTSAANLEIAPKELTDPDNDATVEDNHSSLTTAPTTPRAPITTTTDISPHHPSPFQERARSARIHPTNPFSNRAVRAFNTRNAETIVRYKKATAEIHAKKHPSRVDAGTSSVSTTASLCMETSQVRQMMRKLR